MSTKERWILFLVALGAVSLRLILIERYTFPTWDGTYYINYFLDASWRWVLHPGYPMAIALFRPLVAGGDGVLSAQVVSALAGGLSVVPVYFLASKKVAFRGAIMASILLAVCPIFIHYSIITYSEALYTLILLTAFACYGKPSKGSISGALLGFAYLVRPEALLVAGILIPLYMRGRWWKKWAMMIAFMAVVIPYMLFLSWEAGSPTITPKMMNVREFHADPMANIAQEGMEESTSMWDVAIDAIGQYPSRAMAYTEILFEYAGSILVAGMIGFMITRKRLGGRWILAGMAMLPILPLVGIYPSERFIVPFIPIMIVYAVVAIEEISGWAKWMGYATILATFLMLKGQAVKPLESFPEMKSMGEWASEHMSTNDGSLISYLDRKPYVAFYAGGIYRTIPNGPLDSVVAFMHQGGADFLVLSSRVIPIFRPNLTPLFDIQTATDRGFTLEAVSQNADGTAGCMMYSANQKEE